MRNFMKKSKKNEETAIKNEVKKEEEIQAQVAKQSRKFSLISALMGGLVFLSSTAGLFFLYQPPRHDQSQRPTNIAHRRQHTPLSWQAIYYQRRRDKAIWYFYAVTSLMTQLLCRCFGSSPQIVLYTMLMYWNIIQFSETSMNLIATSLLSSLCFPSTTLPKPPYPSSFTI